MHDSIFDSMIDASESKAMLGQEDDSLETILFYPKWK
jgi:hypothetical protein